MIVAVVGVVHTIIIGILIMLLVFVLDFGEQYIVMERRYL
jgi:hypothetical protein